MQLDGYQKIVTVSRRVKRNRGGNFLKNKIKFETVSKYTSNECQILTLKFCYNNSKVFLTTIYVKPNTSNEKLSTSLGNHFEKVVIPEDCMSVICGDFNINHHTVSSKLKTLQEALLSFDLYYAKMRTSLEKQRLVVLVLMPCIPT